MCHFPVTIARDTRTYQTLGYFLAAFFPTLCGAHAMPRSESDIVFNSAAVFLTTLLLFLATLAGRRRVSRSVEKCPVGDNFDHRGPQEGEPQNEPSTSTQDPERNRKVSKTPLVISLLVKQGGCTFAIVGGKLKF